MHAGVIGVACCFVSNVSVSLPNEHAHTQRTARLVRGFKSEGAYDELKVVEDRMILREPS